MEHVCELVSWPYMIMFIQLWKASPKCQVTEAAHPAVLSWQKVWSPWERVCARAGRASSWVLCTFHSCPFAPRSEE